MSIGFYPCFLDKLFLLNEIMHFQSSSLCFFFIKYKKYIDKK
jgi:hypothetical protein